MIRFIKIIIRCPNSIYVQPIIFDSSLILRSVFCSFVWENLGGFAGWETDLRQDALPRLISQGNLHTKPRKLEQKQQWTSSSSFYEQRKIAQSHSKSNFYCRKKYYYRDYKMVAYRKPWKKLRTVQWNKSEMNQNQFLH